MRRGKLVVVGMLLFGGCGTQAMFPEAIREPAIMRITPAMHAACRFTPDARIAAKITATEAAQADGFSIADLLGQADHQCQVSEVIPALCGTDVVCRSDLMWECLTCNAAIFDAVYR